MSIEPINPAMRVVGFSNAVGGQVTAAFAVCARVRKKNRVAMVKKQLPVAGHAFAIIGDAVQQDDSAAVKASGTHIPRSKCDAINSRDGNILKLRAVALANQCGRLLAMPKRPSIEMDAGLANDYPGSNGEQQVAQADSPNDLQQLGHVGKYENVSGKVPVQNA